MHTDRALVKMRDFDYAHLSLCTSDIKLISISPVLDHSCLLRTFHHSDEFDRIFSAQWDLCSVEVNIS